jgi:ribonuclease P protein component
MAWSRGDILWISPGREASGVIYVLRKSLGIAVKRNRLKRRLRHLCSSLDFSDHSLVILPQFGATEVSFSCLQQELSRLLSASELA